MYSFYNVLFFNYNKICFLNIYVFTVSLQLYSDLFIRISINNVVKCTKPYSLLPPNDEKNAIIAFDEVKFFSVQVMLKFSSRMRMHCYSFKF